MKEKDNNPQLEQAPIAEPQEQEAAPQQQETAPPEPQDSAGSLDSIFEEMGTTASVKAAARAILAPLEQGNAPGKELAELVVTALTHDEDLKNAEAAGYLRGRNESIEEACKTVDGQHEEAAPVKFPIYRKRSFWDN